MPSQEHQPPIYQIPSQPSGQLKVVLDRFNCLKTWGLETLSQLSTPGSTQATLPASLCVPVRSKREDIEFLHAFRDSLKGAPLEIIVYDVGEQEGNVRFGSMYADIPFHPRTPPSRAKDHWQRITYIDCAGILLRLMMKTVTVECLFLFTFGTGDDDDENLIINVTGQQSI